MASTKYKVDKVQVAAPGQSYHPDFETHQDIMAEAVAKEIERQDARKKLAEPLRAGLSEETLQHINMNSDDESDEESDDDMDESSIKVQQSPFWAPVVCIAGIDAFLSFAETKATAAGDAHAAQQACSPQAVGDAVPSAS